MIVNRKNGTTAAHVVASVHQYPTGSSDVMAFGTTQGAHAPKTISEVIG